MPVYEYLCKGCDHEFEREQRIHDKPVKKCPECGAMKAKRQISRTSFVLKGGGWYNDLYSSASNKKPDAEGTGAGEAKSEKSDKSEKSEKPEKSKKPASESNGKGGTKKGGGGKGSKAAA